MIDFNLPAWTRVVLVVALLAVLFTVLSAFNISFADANPGGNDFYVLWRAGRALLLEGRNPYGDDLAIEMQTAISGRASDPEQPGYSMAYPLYVEGLVLPLIFIEEYALARGIWMAVLEVALFATAAIALVLPHPQKPHPLLLLAAGFFAVSWYFGVRAIVNGNIVVVVGLALACALFCIQRRLDGAAGVALAIATIKPQVALLPVILIFLWALKTRRWKIFAGFFIPLAVGFTFAFIVQPDWIAENYRQLLRYPAWNYPGNPAQALESFFGQTGLIIGWLISAAAIILTLYAARNLLRANTIVLTGICCTAILFSPLIGLQTDPGNQIVLLVPILAGAGILATEGNTGKAKAGLLLAVIWSGLWVIFISTLDRGDQPVQSPWMFFPLPAFLLTAILVCLRPRKYFQL